MEQVSTSQMQIYRFVQKHNALATDTVMMLHFSVESLTPGLPRMYRTTHRPLVAANSWPAFGMGWALLFNSSVGHRAPLSTLFHLFVMTPLGETRNRASMGSHSTLHFMERRPVIQTDGVKLHVGTQVFSFLAPSYFTSKAPHPLHPGKPEDSPVPG